jgi:5,6-dimethylbenzimidazole synthase
MTLSPHCYDDASRAAVYRAIYERRDMRHFLPRPVDPETFRRILQAAHAAPSVGLSQPWRFVRITLPALRRQIYELVQLERLRTANALGERHAEFLRLKVEGILDCGELLVCAAQDGGTEEVFGRLSMPQMSLASVACAIQNLWLAARAEGLGMGWVSMFDPQALANLLKLPEDVQPVAVLCIGHVAEFYPAPMLTLENWRSARPLKELVYENTFIPASTDEAAEHISDKSPLAAK